MDSIIKSIHERFKRIEEELKMIHEELLEYEKSLDKKEKKTNVPLHRRYVPRVRIPPSPVRFLRFPPKQSKELKPRGELK